jgi:hypothetical protein
MNATAFGTADHVRDLLLAEWSSCFLLAFSFPSSPS